MLSLLRIKNFALVDELVVEFGPGYNAITGETGAGKSILIGALNLALGERADRALLRAGAEACSVEAVFELGSLRGPFSAFLVENGLDEPVDGALVLRRMITASGANKQFINGSPTTLAILAAAGERLVDIHGPHDHQSLLHTRQQLEILDAYASLQGLREQFAHALRQRRELESRKIELIVDERSYAQQLDLLRHQTREIAAAQLLPGEEEELEQEYQRGTNAARLIELTRQLLGLLGEDETSLSSQWRTAGRWLQDLAKLDSRGGDFLDRHRALLAGLEELQDDLRAYEQRIELDPERLQKMEERLDLLQSLKRKYGASLAEVIDFGKKAAEKLAALEDRDVELARLDEQIKSINQRLASDGQALSAARAKAIPKLTKAITRELKDLGFLQALFHIELTSRAGVEQIGSPQAHLDESGLDQVEFQFSPNPGEPPKPLRSIASSGEMARVMLALKTVLASEDAIPVLVFDEVDANVGGETATKVGEKMRQIARHHQVLCITHLAPVAAQAESHFQAVKQVRQGRAATVLNRLEREERITELARMLGGQSAAARDHAAELLARARRA